jgi:hypothetical protein
MNGSNTDIHIEEEDAEASLRPAIRMMIENNLTTLHIVTFSSGPNTF